MPSKEGTGQVSDSRRCEERSDEAIHSCFLTPGLLRFARNDAGADTFRSNEPSGYGSRRSPGRRKHHTGSAIEYFTWLNAKLDSIEAMPSSRVSLFFRKASYDDRSAATTRKR